MKCSQRGCVNEAQFAKAGEEQAWCEGHSPIHIPPLHDLDELPIGGWWHVDSLVKCESCEVWGCEDEMKTCRGCSERSHDACIAASGRCGACREGADMRAARDHARGSYR